MLRQHSSINLAPWHNFKHGIELIWKQYAHEIFAPLYHRLCPQNKFAIKYQSPQEPTLYIMMVGKAYPMFKDSLTEAIDVCKEHPHDLALLHDIQILCENAIPVVCYTKLIND